MVSVGYEVLIFCCVGCSVLFEIEIGFVIGFDEEVSYGEQILMLQVGDMLLMYIDGIIEVGNVVGDMYGIECILVSLLCVLVLDLLSVFIDCLLGDVDVFVVGYDQIDDIIIFVLSWYYYVMQEECMFELIMKFIVEGVFDVFDCCDSVLYDVGIVVGMCEDVWLVLEELMVNMVQYGYDGLSDGEICLCLCFFVEVVQVELYDNGVLFDLLEVVLLVLSGDVVDV